MTSQKRKRVLSGTRPTDQLHLGNLLGALENWKKFQSDECFFMIADWHALTTEYSRKTAISKIVREVAADYIGAGLDPEKSVIFVQSRVSEHAQLHLLLSMIVPIPWLERNPTYKEQLEEIKGKDLKTYGFLGYPVLQAADILLYKADVVPVGQDQLPHLELTREIARRFNNLYGEFFPEPAHSLAQVPKVLGLDGRKMSKSYGNCIYLADEEETVSRKVLSMVTDPERIRRSDPGRPDVCNVYSFHKIVNEPEIQTVRQECMKATRGCVDCKKELALKLNEFLGPIRERRKKVLNKKGELDEILAEGTRRAQGVAKQVFSEVQERIGM
jgi:tryptophanyl-tRNA synthetase